MTDDNVKQNPIDIIKRTFKRGINLVDEHQSSAEVQTMIYNLPEPLKTVASIILTGLGNYLYKSRLSETLITLYEEIDSLGKTKVDETFLHSEQFKDLVIKTVENSVRTRFKERIRLNCRILAGAIFVNRIEDRELCDEYLNCIAELDPKDLEISRTIYEQQKDRLPKFDIESPDNTELKYIVRKGWHNIPDICHITEQEFTISLLKLARAGLIKEIVGTYSNYTGGLYLITPLFQNLMRFINERLLDGYS